ncbi:MAG: hypothetical protein WBW13_11700 [Pseudolabrys sp.]|jgi:hypothetical protein
MRDAQYLRAQAEFCLEVASQISDLKTVDKLASRRGALSRRGRGNRSYATGAIAALIAHHGVWNRLVVNPHLVSIQANRR